jgi:hypothetical protein
LCAPDAARWAKTWKQKGVSALPSSGVVQLVMPKVRLRWWPDGGTSRELSCGVAVPARLLAVDGAVRVELLGVWMESPPADSNDRLVLRRVLVPRLLGMGSARLKELRFPAQRLFGTSVDLAPVLVDVTGSHLVVAAALPPRSAEAKAIDWPADKRVFILAGPALVTTLVGAAAQQEVDKKEPVVNEKESVAGLADATLVAYFRGLKNLHVDAQNPRRLSAGVDVAWKGAVQLFSFVDGGCALVEASQNM